MKVRYPLYYKSFSCKAGACSDSCCIGWEIDIDPATLEYYNSLEGSFGKRLRDGIENGSFKLCGERCPFLNEINLCDIIINLGRDHLCYICHNHPRYYGWYGKLKEGGVGLSCEEAARLILTEGTSLYYEAEDEADEEGEEDDEGLISFLEEAREHIFRILEGSLSFGEKVALVLAYGEELQDCIDMGLIKSVPEPELCCPEEADGAGEADGADSCRLVDLFSRFEPIRDEWTERLMRLKGKAPVFHEEYLSRILVYFVWRYFMKALYDGDALSKLCFGAAGCYMIAFLAENSSLEAYISAAKLYSAQMEYSEDDRDMLMYDLHYSENVLSPSGLTGLFRNK